jgi:hypothetical protein
MSYDKAEPDAKLLEFIRECRKQGWDDWQIREPLLKNGWDIEEIGAAFLQIKYEENQKLKKKVRTPAGKVVEQYKNSITIHLDTDILKAIEKRAKKNMMNTAEQIVRRSCVNQKNQQSLGKDDVEDKFIGFFSRKR